LAIVEKNKKDKGRLDSFYFGDIMFRFFATENSQCLEKFSKNIHLEKLLSLQTTKKLMCIAKSHKGDKINKNVKIAGKFKYSNNLKIRRQHETPIGIYDNTGIPILLNINE
jgi:hypothetical protein